jgi:uncharacterized protein involved in type VI secretion and phage assembly
MARVMEIVTPLGGDVLLFKSMRSREALGRLFEYSVTALSTRNDIDPKQLLGKNATLKLQLPGGGPRFFDGMVTRFALAGSHGRFVRYEMVLRPWLWFLTRTADCRIFQEQTVPDIIKEYLEYYDVVVDDQRGERRARRRQVQHPLEDAVQRQVQRQHQRERQRDDQRSQKNISARSHCGSWHKIRFLTLHRRTSLIIMSPRAKPHFMAQRLILW